MDFNDPRQREIFFEIHADLPRQGPGNFESTKKALELAGDLPTEPHILDIACGPGMQTMDLAKLMPQARITAFDMYPPFVDELKKRAEAQGCADRITAFVGDMIAPDVPETAFDLIWCEGAAYIMGVENALRSWKRFLKSGGRLALTDAVWLKSDPPVRVRQCWEEYPGMQDLNGLRALVADCGYRLIGDFVLPPEAWWDDYYGPLEVNVARMETKYADDPSASAVIRESREEIEVCRDYGDYYSYAFLVIALDS